MRTSILAGAASACSGDAHGNEPMNWPVIVIIDASRSPPATLARPKSRTCGKIKLLLGHPASVGHGIDGLQDSGSIVVWFGINWSLELYEQMNGRINRHGQTNPVSIIRILCSNTVDLAVADAIKRKNSDQEGLKASLQRYRAGNVGDNEEISFY